MALRCIVSNDCVVDAFSSFQQSSETSLRQERYRRSKSLNRKRSDNQWDLKSDDTTNTADGFSLAATNLLQLYDRCAATAHSAATYCKECISRLQHAAEMLLVEIARGFFLPFCTVAVAAVSRIVALQQLWFAQVTLVTKQLVHELQHDLTSLDNNASSAAAPSKSLLPALWTAVQVEELRQAGLWPAAIAAKTDASKQQRRLQQCRATWESLGIPAPVTFLKSSGNGSVSKKVADSVEGATTAATSTDVGSASDDANVPPEGAAPAAVQESVPVPKIAVNDDMGESVTMAMSQEELAQSAAKNDDGDDDMDHNRALLQDLKAEKKRKKKDNKEKKSKKKKQKKGDFFDALFD